MRVLKRIQILLLIVFFGSTYALGFEFQPLSLSLAKATDWTGFAAFSPDSSKILTVIPERGGRLWDWGAHLRILGFHGLKLPSPLELALYEDILSPSFSPNGTKIVTGSPKNGAKVWDSTNGELLLNLEPGPVLTAIFSPNGERILTASYATVKIWDAESGGTPLVTINLDNFLSSNAEFSPDGNSIVTTSQNEDIARVWNSKDGALRFSLTGHTARVNDARFSPNGTMIVTASTDKTAKLWDAADGTLLFDLGGYGSVVLDTIFSPDSSKVLPLSFTDNVGKVWNTEDGRVAFELRGHSEKITSAAFSPDSSKIITRSKDKTVKIWDAKNGKLLFDINLSSPVHKVLFSPDGKYFLASYGDESNYVEMWILPPDDLVRPLKQQAGLKLLIYSQLLKKFKDTGTIDIYDQFIHFLANYCKKSVAEAKEAEARIFGGLDTNTQNYVRLFCLGGPGN